MEDTNTSVDGVKLEARLLSRGPSYRPSREKESSRQLGPSFAVTYCLTLLSCSTEKDS